MAWDDLPIELLLLIAVTLTEITDQIRFGCVCSRWRSAFRSLLPLPPQQLPWLLLPTPSSTLFYSFSEDRLYSPPVPEDAQSSYLSGSGSGWLLALKGQNQKTFSMVNPFTGALISLPSHDLPQLCPGSLAWDRSDSNVAAACTFRWSRVCYYRLSTHSWDQTERMRIIAENITFYKGRFYILDNFSKIIILEGDTLEEICVINPPNWDQSGIGKVHLVLSSEESIMLLESSVSVYEMDLTEELEEWRAVDDIGNRAVFLDSKHCFLVEVNERNNLRRNCVYRPKSKIVSDSGGTMFEIFVMNLGNGDGEEMECALSTFVVAAPPQGSDFKPSTWFLPSLN